MPQLTQSQRRSQLKLWLYASVLAATTTPVFAANASLELAGRAYEYRVADYHICIEFNSENNLRWTYLAAPAGESGKSSVEQFDRKDIRTNQVLAAWTEQNGTHVTDLFDFDSMRLYASFVMPNGQRYLSEAKIQPTESCQ